MAAFIHFCVYIGAELHALNAAACPRVCAYGERERERERGGIGKVGWQKESEGEKER